MSVGFLTAILVIGNVLGAFGSLLSGVVERFGRASVVVYGLLVLSVITAVGMPLATNKWVFLGIACVTCVIEGMALVAAPGIIRDFSPQSGRGRAMALWVVGPAAGSLLASGVAALTLERLQTWRSQFIIAGVVGGVLAVIAFRYLRELSADLREQAAASEEDKELLEARVAAGTFHSRSAPRWRSVMTVAILLPVIGFPLMLIYYHTVITLAPILFATAFGLDSVFANALVSASWAFFVVAAFAGGFVADRFLVRKPWILLGALLCTAVQVSLIFLIGHDAGVLVLGTAMALLGIGWGLVQVPWFAAFTETVEARDPALVGKALAVWGWTLRIVATICFGAVSFVVPAADKVINGDLSAVAAAHTEWQSWLVISVIGGLLSAATIPLMAGRWRTRDARRDAQRQAIRRDEELARLRTAPQATTPAP
jgi:MFS family permease